MTAPAEEQVKVDAAMLALGATREDVAKIARESKTVEEGRARLEELKAAAKKRAKQLALELHPDRTGGDAEKLERLQYINRVLQELLKLEVRAPQPQPTVTFRVVQMPMQWRWGNTSAASSTTADWSVTGSGWIRV